MPKTVYITATRPGDGKTVVTLGLTSALMKKTEAIGFIKPLGRRLSATDQLDPDVPLIEKACGIKCETADRLGNLTYRKTARNFSPLMCMAAKTTIVQARRIVEPGEIDPEHVVTPCIFVDRLVEVPEPLYESRLIAAGVTYP